MNNRIARKLNQCRHEADPKRAANIVATEIVDTHNAAVGNGFIDLPTLDFGEAIIEDTNISIGVRPKSGLITLNDLYALETIWGANEINILTGDCGAVELVFKK